MKLLLISFMHAFCIHGAFSFSPHIVNVKHAIQTSTSLDMSAVSDAQEMLRKARDLRAQAEAAEHTLHTHLLHKKDTENEGTDQTIAELFPVGLSHGPDGVTKLAQTLEEKKLSASCLKKVVERLHEREISAKGLSHVESSQNDTGIKFEKISKTNEGELKKVEGLIKMLISAAAILDDKAVQKSLEQGSKHRVDEHWRSGKLSETLSGKAHFLSREHDEQFKSRLNEYYDTVNKKHKDKKEDE